jgi:acetylxylan esterase
MLSFNLVKGVVVFGDPTFTAGEPFDAGSATTNGIFSRSASGSSMAKLKTYASVLKSYCDAGDPVCAEGDDVDVHDSEVQNHAQAAAAFIASLV